MSGQWRIRMIIALLTAGCLMAGAAILTWSRSPRVADAGANKMTPSQISPSLNGIYSGVVTLQYVYTGVYSDAVAAPAPPGAGTPAPPDLGHIDVALSLGQSGGRLGHLADPGRDCPNGDWAGYIVLDNTLVFTEEHQIMVTPVAPPVGASTPAPAPQPLSIGPCIRGTQDGAIVYLESEPVSVVIAPQQTFTDPSATTQPHTLPEQRVRRQFRMTIPTILNRGDTLAGEYRETIWGYSLQPYTIVGHFSLSRPTFATATPSQGGTPEPTSTRSPGQYRIFLPDLIQDSS